MKSGGSRIARINDEILRETAGIIRSELKDPRIGQVCSVTKVDTTPDLKYCKVFVSVLGDEELRKSTAQGLNNATGFIRKQLAQRINLRNTPELTFIMDDSMEYGFRMNRLIDQVVRGDASHSEDHSEQS